MDTIKQNRQPHSIWQVFGSHMSNKELVTRINNKSQHNNKRITQSKTWPKMLVAIEKDGQNT
jgi:hypothetical protein